MEYILGEGSPENSNCLQNINALLIVWNIPFLIEVFHAHMTIFFEVYIVNDIIHFPVATGMQCGENWRQKTIT